MGTTKTLNETGCVRDGQMADIDSRALVAEFDEFRRRRVSGIAVDQLTFSIMHGNGNVIMVVDEGLSRLSGSEIGAELARELCGSFRSVRVERGRVRPGRYPTSTDDVLRARRHSLADVR